MLHRPNRDQPDTTLDIDHLLVGALEGVEHAVRDYLADLSASSLDALEHSLEEVDGLAAASDQWAHTLASLGGWGFVNREAAIGQTSSTPVIDHEGSSLFQLQVTLVHAAKAVVQQPSPEAVEALRGAWARVRDIDQQAE